MVLNLTSKKRAPWEKEDDKPIPINEAWISDNKSGIEGWLYDNKHLFSSDESVNKELTRFSYCVHDNHVTLALSYSSRINPPKGPEAAPIEFNQRPDKFRQQFNWYINFYLKKRRERFNVRET